MWIKGLGGLYFSALERSAGQSLYGYDSVESGFDEIRTKAGSSFTVYSKITEIFGELLVSGRANGVEGDAIGYELYQLNPDGSLSLFADVAPGSASSFFDLDTLVPGFGDETRVMALAGGGDAVPTFVYPDGSTSNFEEEIPEIDEITYFNQAYLFNDGLVFRYRSNPDVALSGHSYFYDFQTGDAHFLNTFSMPLYPNFSVRNHWMADGRLFADIRGWKADGSESVFGLWELIDGVWTYLSQPGSDYSLVGASPGMVFNGEVYVVGKGQYGRELYKVTETGVEIGADFWPDTSVANGILTFRHFFYGDDVYMTTGTYVYLPSGRWEGLFRMTPEGTLQAVSTIGPDNLPAPTQVIDLDRKTFQTYLTDDSPDHVHIIEDGEIRMLAFPGGEVMLRGFHAGTFYITASDSESNRDLFALVGNDWVNVSAGINEPSDLEFSRFVQIHAIDNAPDVWLGDDTDELISSEKLGTIIYARGGDDTVYAGDGDDRVFAGSGNDSVYGGDGRDTVNLGDGEDTYSDTSQNDINGRDVITGGNGNDHINGGGGNDIIDGGNGHDILVGANGFDTISGGAGFDKIFGGNGNDTVNGGNGRDTVYLGAGDDIYADTSQNDGFGVDIVNGELGNDRINGGGGADVLNGNRGSDTLIGANGFDTLNGGLGDDRLFGGNGNDILNGGFGNDLLNGGTGNDVFVFADGFGKDTIVGFAASNDLEDIDLSAVTSIVNFIDLSENHMSQSGSDVVIDTGAGNVITLEDVNIDAMNFGDFLFV